MARPLIFIARPFARIPEGGIASRLSGDQGAPSIYVESIAWGAYLNARIKAIRTHFSSKFKGAGNLILAGTGPPGGWAAFLVGAYSLLGYEGSLRIANLRCDLKNWVRTQAAETMNREAKCESF